MIFLTSKLEKKNEILGRDGVLKEKERESGHHSMNPNCCTIKLDLGLINQDFITISLYVFTKKYRNKKTYWYNFSKHKHTLVKAYWVRC
jgi:hypothetical protein